MTDKNVNLPDEYQHREGGEYEFTEDQLGEGHIERLPSFEKPAATTGSAEQGGEKEFGGLLPPSRPGEEPVVMRSASVSSRTSQEAQASKDEQAQGPGQA